MVERFCQVVNDLIGLGVVKENGNLWLHVAEKMSNVIDKPNHGPLWPSRKMFKRHRLFEVFGDNEPLEQKPLSMVENILKKGSSHV